MIYKLNSINNNRFTTLALGSPAQRRTKVEGIRPADAWYSPDIETCVAVALWLHAWAETFVQHCSFGALIFLLHATQHDTKQGTWGTLFNISTYKTSHKQHFTAMLAKMSARQINCHFSSFNCESLLAWDY